MGFVSKNYLSTQFTNFASRISEVFAKKTELPSDTTYTFATGDTNGQIKVTPSGGTAQNVSVKGLGDSAYKGVATSITSGGTNLPTAGAVYTAIDNSKLTWQ